jgi:Tfp pilus assembly protein PilF
LLAVTPVCALKLRVHCTLNSREFRICNDIRVGSLTVGFGVQGRLQTSPQATVRAEADQLVSVGKSAGLRGCFGGPDRSHCRLASILPSRFIMAVIVAATLAVKAHAHEGMPGMSGRVSSEPLGSVTFENSCKPQVKARLNLAVALLHSFWLDEAQRAFRDVAATDPQCAIAQWGVAIASLHQINGDLSAADIEAGSAALARADAAREKTAREAGYIGALHAFYAGYSRERYFERAQAYADAMQAVVTAYPGDPEAKAFYALGLLTSIAPDDLTLEKPRRAVAVLRPLLRAYPDHPGIAHYIIHACDNPQMAGDGLAAARHYAKIAPAAPHALHMPSHIFARLGLWQEDIQSNLASKAAAEKVQASAENRLHAMEFLEYAYLQTGEDAEAQRLAQEAVTVKASDVNPAYPDYFGIVQARFQALLAIETQDWSRAASLEPIAGAGTYSRGLTLLARAIAAGHTGDAGAADAAEQAYESLLAREPIVRAGGGFDTLHREIKAWAELAGGRPDAAVTMLQPVSERQRRVGKGEVELPAAEMMAEALLRAGKATQALQVYQASLVTDPNRLNGLLGAGRAAEASHQDVLAAQYYRAALKLCSQAGDVRRLRHARDVVRSHPT